jgi:uncharacterized protein YdeI (YjbR/CyaY-like superfamily)
MTQRPLKTPGQKASAELPVKHFSTKKDWAAWLDENHGQNAGLWLRIAKKGSALQSVTYQEALDVALCYGWIDGQKRPENASSWLQRFCPRGARSLWSKINREKALRLLASGEMKPAGAAAIDKAKRAGRWESAYDSSTTSAVPDDLQAALEVNPAAKAFFDTLDKTNRYAILWRIQTVKRVDTRARKIEQFVEMLARGERIHEG